MAEDQPLGFFPRSSRSPTRWCLVSRGKPHSDFPMVPTMKQLLLRLFQDWTFATLASLQSVSQVCEPQPPWRPPCLRHPLRYRFPVLAYHPLCAKVILCRPLHCHNPPAVGLLTGAKVVKSLSRLSVGSPSNLRLFKPKFIAWHAHPTLLLRLHLPLPSGFPPVVAARIPCRHSAPSLLPLALLASPAHAPLNPTPTARWAFAPPHQSEVSATLSPSCPAADNGLEPAPYCTSPRKWCMILFPCRERTRGAARLNDGAATPTSLVLHLAWVSSISWAW